MTQRNRLDRIDLKIVETVQNDARITNQALAEKIALSPSPCLTRFRRLEREGVIGPYFARIDLGRICRSVTVFATVTLRSHEQGDFEAFESAVRHLPEAIRCYKVSGTFDYLVQFVCPDIRRYHELSDELLKESAGIVNLTSHVVLDQAKTFKGYPLGRLVEEDAL